MDNKYYTPQIEELLQFIISEGYILDWNLNKIVIDSNDIANQLYNFFSMNDLSSDGTNKIYSLNPELYKIKYLDQQDIEDCGFKLTDKTRLDSHNCLIPDMMYDESVIYRKIIEVKNDDGEIFFTKIYDLTYDSECNYVQINTNTLNSPTIFYGCIKNKSELLVVLRQLGIK